MDHDDFDAVSREIIHSLDTDRQRADAITALAMAMLENLIRSSWHGDVAMANAALAMAAALVADAGADRKLVRSLSDVASACERITRALADEGDDGVGRPIEEFAWLPINMISIWREDKNLRKEYNRLLLISVSVRYLVANLRKASDADDLRVAASLVTLAGLVVNHLAERRRMLSGKLHAACLALSRRVAAITISVSALAGIDVHSDIARALEQP